MKKTCKYPGCITVLSSRNNKYCFIHQLKAEEKKLEAKEELSLSQSKKWNRITQWVEDPSTIQHATETFKKGDYVYYKRKQKGKFGYQPMYAVYAKTLGKGEYLNKKYVYKEKRNAIKNI